MLVHFLDTLVRLVVDLIYEIFQLRVLLFKDVVLLLELASLLKLHLQVAVEPFHLQTNQCKFILIVLDLSLAVGVKLELRVQAMILFGDVLHPIFKHRELLQLGLEDLVKTLNL